MWSRLASFSFIFSVSLLPGAIPESVQAAPPELRDETAVVIAEDKTAEADCKTWVDSPVNERPCESGSIIFAHRTTYGQVKQDHITDYAILTGNPQQDQLIQDALVSNVRRRIKGEQVVASSTPTIAACWNHSKTIGGSYLSIPSDANSTRMFYQVNYQVWVDCAITWVQDQSKTSGAQMNWLQSCSKGTANCSRRDILVNGNWTAWQGMLNTTVGSEYRHLSAAPCWNCGMPYGINTFVQ